MRLRFLISACLSLFLMCEAYAGNSSATLTADNHYGLFLGDETGSNLRFIGRNEIGPNGSTGGNNWTFPETWAFDADPGDFIYVVAWDDANSPFIGAHFFLGAFSGPNGDIFTNKSDWVAKRTFSGNPGDYGSVPSDGDIVALIGSGAWGQILAEATAPPVWLSIAGFTSDSKKIWVDSFTGNSTGYALFRTVNPLLDSLPVPEPSVLSLFLIGLIAFSAIRANAYARFS